MQKRTFIISSCISAGILLLGIQALKISYVTKELEAIAANDRAIQINFMNSDYLSNTINAQMAINGMVVDAYISPHFFSTGFTYRLNDAHTLFPEAIATTSKFDVTGDFSPSNEILTLNLPKARFTAGNNTASVSSLSTTVHTQSDTVLAPTALISLTFADLAINIDQEPNFFIESFSFDSSASTENRFKIKTRINQLDMTLPEAKESTDLATTQPFVTEDWHQIAQHLLPITSAIDVDVDTTLVNLAMGNTQSLNVTEPIDAKAKISSSIPFSSGIVEGQVSIKPDNEQLLLNASFNQESATSDQKKFEEFASMIDTMNQKSPYGLLNISYKEAKIHEIKSSTSVLTLKANIHPESYLFSNIYGEFSSSVSYNQSPDSKTRCKLDIRDPQTMSPTMFYKINGEFVSFPTLGITLPEDDNITQIFHLETQDLAIEHTIENSIKEIISEEISLPPQKGNTFTVEIFSPN